MLFSFHCCKKKKQTDTIKTNIDVLSEEPLSSSVRRGEWPVGPNTIGCKMMRAMIRDDDEMMICTKIKKKNEQINVRGVPLSSRGVGSMAVCSSLVDSSKRHTRNVTKKQKKKKWSLETKKAWVLGNCESCWVDTTFVLRGSPRFI